MVKQLFGCVYRLTNLVTKKTYIGKSVNFKQRMSEHKHSMKKAKTYLSKSINKHGWDNFKKEIIIDDVPEEDLSNLEISYIEVENTMVPNGYNLTRGGEGTSGYKKTPEQRENSRQAQLRRRANRDQFGSVSFNKSKNKYHVKGPRPESKFIGYYFTKEKAKEALNLFNIRGKRMESDIIRRKNGTGTIRKKGKRYQAIYFKNKKRITKTLDTKEECEEWLKTELKL
jgi:group I intron endonuclease